MPVPVVTIEYVPKSQVNEFAVPVYAVANVRSPSIFRSEASVTVREADADDDEVNFKFPYPCPLGIVVTEVFALMLNAIVVKADELSTLHVIPDMTNASGVGEFVVLVDCENVAPLLRVNIFPDPVLLNFAPFDVNFNTADGPEQVILPFTVTIILALTERVPII